MNSESVLVALEAWLERSVRATEPLVGLDGHQDGYWCGLTDTLDELKRLRASQEPQ